ncbi:MAG: DUF1501 domain-containing protein [Polyangiaceae bacterium]
MSNPTKLGRRGFLSAGLAGIALALGDRSLGRVASALPKPTNGPATSCVVLWMNGGPSHLDTFDPKPGTKVAGPHKVIDTAVSGVKISEHLPGLAALGGDLALVRGMTSKEGNHQRAQEYGRTGHVPNPTVAAPALGAWIAKYRPKGNLALPGFISLGGPSQGGGFLGNEYDPLVIASPGSPPDDMRPFQPLSDARDQKRRSMRDMLDAEFAKRTGDRRVATRGAILGRATAMMRSSDARAFSIDEEPEAVKAAYGDTDFGRGCLTARRLVEIGVPFVEVTLDGWDTHDNGFERTQKLMTTLDAGASALVRELKERGLLKNTLVVCMGDFGRTPDINGDDGRDHYPAAWSAWLAGGGIRGGVVRGETDAEGRKVTKDATRVEDLLATVSDRLGLDPLTEEHTSLGRPISVTDDGLVLRDLFV